MKKELFEKLANLRIKEREIETQIKELIPLVYAEADGQEDGAIIHTTNGNFSVSYLRKWKFPLVVEELKKKFKEAEEGSKRLGTATYTLGISLKFNDNKNE